MAGAGGLGRSGLGRSGLSFHWRLGRSGLRFHGRLGRSGLGRSGLTFDGRLASAGASMPSFLIRLRRWLSRRAQAVLSPSGAARRRVPPRADLWPPSPFERWRLSAVRQPRSRRRAGARAQSQRPQGQTSSARGEARRRRKEWLQAAKDIVQVDPRVHTGCGQVTVFETSI